MWKGMGWRVEADPEEEGEKGLGEEETTGRAEEEYADRWEW